jgi:hypothetical protein
MSTSNKFVRIGRPVKLPYKKYIPEITTAYPRVTIIKSLIGIL